MYERMSPDPYEGWSDAQIAAKHAAGALQAGRLDLGWAFARIAIEARKAERDSLPTPLMPAMEPPFTQVQESARCQATVMKDDVEAVCWNVITLDPQTSTWVHLDPALDTHQPQTRA